MSTPLDPHHDAPRRGAARAPRAAAPVRVERLAAPLPDGGALALTRTWRRGCSGPPVLLVHGFGMNGLMWTLRQRSLAAALAARGRDVYVVELRGVGRSRQLGSAVAAHLRQHVDVDLGAALDAALARSRAARAFVVGHSMGGLIACCAAPTLADRLAGLVTLAGVFDFARDNRVLAWLCQLEGALGRAPDPGHAGRRPLELRLVARLLRAGLPLVDSPLAWRLMPFHAWAPGSIERPLLVEHMRRGWDASSLGVLRGLLRIGHDATAAWVRPRLEAMAALDLPLLVVASEHDTLLSATNARRAHDLSRSRDRSLEILSTARGHAPHGHLDLVLGRRAPAEVWPALDAWLRARCA